MCVHTRTHATTIVVGCSALRVSTRDSYRCPLVAALSPMEKLGQNCVWEIKYVASSSLWFMKTKAHTHTSNVETHNKSIFILPLPWLFMPSSISPPLEFSTSCLSAHNALYVYVSVCCCLHSSKDWIINKELLQQPFASHIILGSFNHSEWTAFTKSFDYKSQVLYNGSYSSHSHTQMVSALPCKPMTCSLGAVRDSVFCSRTFPNAIRPSWKMDLTHLHVSAAGGAGCFPKHVCKELGSC